MLQVLCFEMLFIHAIFVLGILVDGKIASNSEVLPRKAAESTPVMVVHSILTPLPKITVDQRIVGEEAFSPKIDEGIGSTTENTNKSNTSENFTEMKESTSSSPPRVVNVFTSALVTSLSHSIITSQSPDAHSKHTSRPSSTFNWKPYASIASEYVDFSTRESTTPTTPSSTDDISTSQYDGNANIIIEETTVTLESDQTATSIHDDVMESGAGENSSDDIMNLNKDSTFSETEETTHSSINKAVTYMTDDTTTTFTEETTVTVFEESAASTTDLINYQSSTATISVKSDTSLTNKETETSLHTAATSTYKTIENNQTILESNNRTKVSDMGLKDTLILKDAELIVTAEAVATTRVVPKTSTHVSTMDTVLSHSTLNTTSESLPTQDLVSSTVENITSFPSMLTEDSTSPITSTTLTSTTAFASTFNWKTFLPTSFGKSTSSTEISIISTIDSTAEMTQHGPPKVEYRMSMQSVVGVLLITLTVLVACVITSIVAVQRYKNQRMLIDDSVALMSGRRGQSRVFYYDTSI